MKPVLQKILNVTVALAVTVGVVVLARLGLRAAVFAHPGSAEASLPDLPTAAAPRESDLARLVPPALRVNVSGMAVQDTRRRLDVPYSLAVETSRAEAESRGWIAFDNSLPRAVAASLHGESVYRTPTGGLVIRHLTAIKGNRTDIEDFVVPVGPDDALVAASPVRTPFDLAGRYGLWIRTTLPAVLAGPIVGAPFYTQLLVRGGGAAFVVLSVTAVSPAAFAAAFASACRAAGYVPLKGRPGVFTRGNLSVSATAQVDNGGTVVSTRFSDDEVYIPKEGQHDQD